MGIATVGNVLDFPVKHSPNINAARLFAAWMAVEGIDYYLELHVSSMRAWPDSGSWLAKKIAELGGELSMLTSREALKQAETVRGQIVSEYKKLVVK